ncbi:MAG: Hpt domain-containing protein [Prochlorothrix sp.]|nr:Hpt domain-containing protein [Prochlorothrix sp.]
MDPSPSPVSPDTLPAIDAELIRLNLGALGEDAAECLTFLTETFTQDTPAMLAQMQQSAAQQDADGLRRSAHTLKSSSATLGATRLSKLCLLLETQARAGDFSQAVELVQQAKSAYEAAKIGLETFEW